MSFLKLLDDVCRIIYFGCDKPGGRPMTTASAQAYRKAGGTVCMKMNKKTGQPMFYKDMKMRAKVMAKRKAERKKEQERRAKLMVRRKAGRKKEQERLASIRAKVTARRKAGVALGRNIKRVTEAKKSEPILALPRPASVTEAKKSEPISAEIPAKLPVLTGTEKQVGWGEGIRGHFIEKINSIRKKDAHNLPEDYNERSKVRISDNLDRVLFGDMNVINVSRKDKVAGGEELLETKTHASFWIKNRAEDRESLLLKQAVLRKRRDLIPGLEAAEERINKTSLPRLVGVSDKQTNLAEEKRAKFIAEYKENALPYLLGMEHVTNPKYNQTLGGKKLSGDERRKEFSSEGYLEKLYSSGKEQYPVVPKGFVDRSERGKIYPIPDIITGVLDIIKSDNRAEFYLDLDRMGSDGLAGAAARERGKK